MMKKTRKNNFFGSGTGNEVPNSFYSTFKNIFYGFMGAEKVINFWDLPVTTRFELESIFRQKLFSAASNGNNHELASKLGVSYPFISPLRNGTYSISLKTLCKLSALSGIDYQEIQKNISLTKTRHGIGTRISYPIISNPLIAALVGHSFGDGYIPAKKRQFEYINFDNGLLSTVEKKVENIFGIKPISRKENSLVFPSIVGDLWVLKGVKHLNA